MTVAKSTVWSKVAVVTNRSCDRRMTCFSRSVPLEGGEGRTIEIDESKFGRRKYNRGKRVEGQWVFRLLERETGEFFFSIMILLLFFCLLGKAMLVSVATRDRATLIPIIRKYVRPNSVIISDLWKAYDTLGDVGYTHLTVNHSLTFKDPETGANTNRIESTWRAVKASYNSSGRGKKFFGRLLGEISFHEKMQNHERRPLCVLFQSGRRNLLWRKWNICRKRRKSHKWERTRRRQRKWFFLKCLIPIYI